MMAYRRVSEQYFDRVVGRSMQARGWKEVERKDGFVFLSLDAATRLTKEQQQEQKPVPEAQANKRKRGRPRKVESENRMIGNDF